MQVPCAISDQFWTGGRFLSARSVLLWTNHGNAYVYYLGNENDVVKGGLAEAPREAIVLFSDGKEARWVREMRVGADGHGRCRLVVCQTRSGFGALCYVQKF